MSGEAIVFLGCNRAGFDVLRHLVDAGYEIDEIVSLSPEQGAAFGVSGYHNFADFATANDIPLYYAESYGLDSEQDVNRLTQSPDRDLLIVDGWQRLVPERILRSFRRGAIGVHGSAFGLPKGRGRSPMNWSLIEDFERFLLSIIRLEPGADSGAVLATKKFDITLHDDIETLYYKQVVETISMLEDCLDPFLDGHLDGRDQQGTPTYYPKREPEDGGIHWGERTKRIYNLVRAVSDPYPGAFTAYEGQRIFLWKVLPFSQDLYRGADPGEIMKVFTQTEDFVVGTADGTLLVREWHADDDWRPVEGMVLESLANESIGSPDRNDSPLG